MKDEDLSWAIEISIECFAALMVFAAVAVIAFGALLLWG
jgi:hypothetical protein